MKLQACEVEVQDEGILMDIDTPEDYSEICRVYNSVMNERDERVIGITESLCPVCLDRIPARRIVVVMMYIWIKPAGTTGISGR